MSKQEGEKYLGDGLYVSFDGWQVKLRAPHLRGDHEVFLDGDVLQQFLAWVEEGFDMPPKRKAPPEESP